MSVSLPGGETPTFTNEELTLVGKLTWMLMKLEVQCKLHPERRRQTFQQAQYYHLVPPELVELLQTVLSKLGYGSVRVTRKQGRLSKTCQNCFGLSISVTRNPFAKAT